MAIAVRILAVETMAAVVVNRPMLLAGVESTDGHSAATAHESPGDIQLSIPSSITILAGTP
jgi:hypothetical protein